MFDWVLNVSLLHVKNKKLIILHKKPNILQFLFMDGVFITFLKATEPLS